MSPVTMPEVGAVDWMNRVRSRPLAVSLLALVAVVAVVALVALVAVVAVVAVFAAFTVPEAMVVSTAVMRL